MYSYFTQNDASFVPKLVNNSIPPEGVAAIKKMKCVRVPNENVSWWDYENDCWINNGVSVCNGNVVFIIQNDVWKGAAIVNGYSDSCLYILTPDSVLSVLDKKKGFVLGVQKGIVLEDVLSECLYREYGEGGEGRSRNNIKRKGR
jgi:hypothetical protein